MFLSAALIVKDEERSLGRCLRSLTDVVDEVVVVDTGSTDGSVDIAESFGATVLHRPWDGDFSAARNHGLDHVHGDWVLYVDADEYLAPTTRADVQRALQHPEAHVAYRLRLRHRQGFTPYFEYRIWRNRPDIRFWGVIHESVAPSIFRVAASESLKIGLAELLLEHDGYEGDQRHKHERNLPLLLQQVEEDPTRTYLWDHIGRIREELERHDEAREAWQRGIDLVRANGVVDESDSLVYFDLMQSDTARGAPDESIVDEALSLFPDNALIYWGAAHSAAARSDHATVIDLIDRLLAISPEHTARIGLGLNERISGEWAFHIRGMAEFKLADFAAAAADFAAAEALAPDVDEYRVKRLLAESRASY
ncbi:MAG TPA: glycosyltransferase [Acidimicrobiales bacterium]|nr:glycosyltransferase [Acidimicrobiales bacterium]